MRPFPALLLTSSVWLALACEGPRNAPSPAAPGDPLPGLTEAELASFERGKAWFDRGWTPEEGLGPLYLQERCSSCHDLPALGGTGVELLPLMTRWDTAVGCDPLLEEGGPVRQESSTPLARAAGILHEAAAPSATERVQEVAPLLFGLGLMEAIPEASIESRADPEDADGDGISGRVNILSDGRFGRLSRKADVATIRELVEAALATELGLTTLRYPAEEGLNGIPLPPGLDPAPDPEVDEKTILAIADFLRFLAPPEPEIPASPQARDSVAEGSRLFQAIGCTSCHTPILETGPNPIAALDRKPVRLYSDLLIHDLGPEVRSACSGNISPTEVRTARLSGLRLREPYAISWVTPGLEQRILNHGGEARQVREAFEGLNREGRNMVLRFLLSL